MLHAHDAGIDARRATHDADALTDVRGPAQATRRVSSTLTSLGWEIQPGHPTPDDIGFRFVKDDLMFDVLAPEGLAPKTDITTVPPLTSVPIAGGSRALGRTSARAVTLGDRLGHVPVPDLLGALVVKSRAAATDRTQADPAHRPERHPEDLAVLNACVTDLRLLGHDATAKDRRALARAPEPHWRVLSADLRPQAQAAYRFLAKAI